MKKTGTSTIYNFDNDLWGHHFIVPHEIGNEFIDGTNRRVLCSINGSKPIHCALMHYGDKGFFININKEVRSSLGIKEGDSINYTLEKDNSEYGMPVPEEFSELIAMDPEGEQLFKSLTMGTQRSLIYIIGKPKTSATRLHKALAIIEYLKEVNGQLDFREMNQFIKEFNKL